MFAIFRKRAGKLSAKLDTLRKKEAALAVRAVDHINAAHQVMEVLAQEVNEAQLVIDEIAPIRLNLIILRQANPASTKHVLFRHRLAGLNLSQAGPQGLAKFADVGTGAGPFLGIRSASYAAPGAWKTGSKKKGHDFSLPLCCLTEYG